MSEEPGAKSKPGGAGRELEKRPATLAPAVTDLSFPAWRWQETTSCRCHGSQRSTARAGASARREEERSERRPSSSHGAAASQGGYKATIISQPHHGTGRIPPVPPTHATPGSWRQPGLPLDGRRAPGRAAAAASGAPAPHRSRSCPVFGRSLCRRLQGLLQGLRWVTGNS